MKNKQDENNFGCWALIEITKDKHCRLLATLNPDADKPICGELYSDAWSIPVDEVAERFNKFGFWETWDKISGEQSGGIELTDDLQEDELFRFMGREITEELCGNSKHIAEKVETLAVGEYLIVIDDNQLRMY